MTIKYSDWIGELTPTVGTGDITLGGAIFGFATFESLGDTEVYYAIVDGLNKETGVGTITGRVLQRTTITSVMIGDQFVPNAAPINLSGNAQVYGIINSRYFQDIQEEFANVFLAIESAEQNSQPLDQTLTAFAGLVGSADKLPYFNGIDTFALATFTSFARTLLDDADSATARTTLGVDMMVSKGSVNDFNSMTIFDASVPFTSARIAITDYQPANRPASSINWWFTEVYPRATGGGSVYYHQFAISITSNEVWERVNASIDSGVTISTFGTWTKVYKQSNVVGAVSQTGGIPTGAVIERGSNANGSYVRFADGTQICTAKRNNSIALSSWQGGFLSASNSWTFPVSFSAAPVLSVVSVDDASRGFGSGVSNTTSATVYHYSSGTAGTRLVTQELAANGRWF